MPIMNGYVATTNLKKLMEEGVIPKIQIVACTAFASSAEENKCKDVGMDGFVTKPIRYKDLEKYLSKVVKDNSSG